MLLGCVGPLCALAGPGAGAVRADTGAPPTPWLGIGLGEGKLGVLVVEVYPRSPAYLCGLKAGDEVIRIDGEPMLRGRDIQDHVQGRRGVGDEVVVELVRDGAPHRCVTMLDRFPSREEQLLLRLVDRPAPDFELEPASPGVAPRAGKLAAYRGQVVVVAFASVDCEPCAPLFPALSELAATRGREGLAVVVITDDSAAAVERALATSPVRRSFLRDAGNQLRTTWLGEDVRVPFLLVLDRDGVVRFAGRGLKQAGPALDRALRERNGIRIE